MEEEPTTTTTNTTLSDHSDSTLQRKHSAMIQRLSNLHQSRSTPKPDFHMNSTNTFLSHFSESKNSIQSTLSTILNTPDPHSNPEILKSEINKISISITNLEKSLAENTFSLPSYDVRTCLKTLTHLKQSVEQVSCKVLPKKKFSFKNKKKVTLQNDVVSQMESNNSVFRVMENSPVLVKEFDNDEEIRELDNSVFRVLENSPGFRGNENEVLVKEFNRDNDDDDYEIREFVLSDLRNCEVRLVGRVRALFVNKLSYCKVYIGPVYGSVLIEEVTDCVFVMASHQIRIHQAKKCDFYLQVRSRPIIEDSDGVRFAPYCLKYDGIEKDLEEANLGEETGNWSNVDDFKWLRAMQSPNWSILPENERIGTVDISK